MSKYNSINIYSKLLLIFLSSFLIQFINVNIGISHIKIFMIFSVIFVFVLLPVFKISKFSNHEVIWLVSYLIILLSGFYAQNLMLAFQIMIGEIILVISFLLYRFLSENISLKDFEMYFNIIGQYFISISFILYLLGIFLYFVLHETPSQSSYLNEHSIRIIGLYLEGYIPRFTGLAESPNHYSYFALLFMWFFVYKKNFKFVVITLFSLILTLSTSCYLVLLVQVFIFCFFCNRRNVLRIMILFSLIIFFIFFIYIENEFIRNIIDYRITRNSTGSGRLGLWSYVLDLLSNSPIFGYGVNQNRILIAPYRNLMSAHNSVLDISLMSGMFGGITYIFFLVLLVRNSFFLTLKFKTPMFLLLSVSFVIIGISNNTLHIEYVVFYLGFIHSYKVRQVSCDLK